MRPAARGVFVTGTDTGVGKTLIACALLHAAHKLGRRVVGMKPVAAGCERKAGALVSEDVTMLCAASSEPAPLELVNPFAFEPAIAPHLAAEEAQRAIDPESIAGAFRELAREDKFVVVEGAGGFLVPLGADFDMADLACRLGLPVVLVVGLRLGCLNHALLTAAAIRSAGLPLAGWVANQVDADMLRPDANLRSLVQRLDAPLVGSIPFISGARAPQVIAAMLDTTWVGSLTS